MEQSLRKTRIEILLLFVLYLFILPRVSMEYDMGFWKDWALIIHQHGIGNAYNSSINYFPVFLYGLYFYDWLQGSELNIIHNIQSIKILFVCFDFLPLFVLCCYRQKILSFKIPHLFLLLNVAYVFNSMVWGQIDSIYTNLSFLAIVSGIFYPVAGGILYLLALNTKPQAIEFFPVIALVLWYSIQNIKTLFFVVGSVVATQLVILIPFYATGGVAKLLHHAIHSVDLYNNLSISAFNIWYLIQRGNPYFINDKDTFLFFSYKTYGLVFFSISAVFALYPLFRQLMLQKTKGGMPNNKFYQVIFLSTGLLCLYFFYFNTQMHERYAHPIVIFFFFYGVVSQNYWLYILASIPYLLSLDKCFAYPDGYLPIVHYKIIYASVIIAGWYTAAVAYGSYLLYKLYYKKAEL